jgi:hypothetical protein
LGGCAFRAGALKLRIQGWRKSSFADALSFGSNERQRVMNANAKSLSSVLSSVLMGTV